MNYSPEHAEQWFKAQAKSPENFKLGFEIERFAVNRDTGEAISYYGDSVSVRHVLELLCGEHGYSPEYIDGHLLGASGEFADISLEPGAQVEISMKPQQNYQTLVKNFAAANNQLCDISQKLGFAWIAAGLHPYACCQDIAMIPKNRYNIMRDYFLKKGTGAHYMMKSSCSTQVSVDFMNTRHFSQIFRLSFALSPLFTAWFANSAVSADIKNNYKNKRSLVWRKTDPDRCGLIPGVLNPGFSFLDYIRYCENVPMIFGYNSDRTDLIPAEGKSFIKHCGSLGKNVQMEDFFLHMTGIFTLARVRNYVEIRCCDALPPRYLLAVPALFAGLYYSDTALLSLEKLFEDVTEDEVKRALNDAALNGLQGHYRSMPLYEVAELVYKLAETGLDSLMGPDDFDAEYAKKSLSILKRLYENHTVLADEVFDPGDESHPDIRKFLKIREIKHMNPEML